MENDNHSSHTHARRPFVSAASRGFQVSHEGGEAPATTTLADVPGSHATCPPPPSSIRQAHTHTTSSRDTLVKLAILRGGLVGNGDRYHFTPRSAAILKWGVRGEVAIGGRSNLAQCCCRGAWLRIVDFCCCRDDVVSLESGNAAWIRLAGWLAGFSDLPPTPMLRFFFNVSSDLLLGIYVSGVNSLPV